MRLIEIVKSAATSIRTGLLWVVTQSRVVILYRRFGTTYLSHLKGQEVQGPLKIGPIRCPETSVKDYHSTLRNTTEQRSCHQHRGGSLKSQLLQYVHFYSLCYIYDPLPKRIFI
jgi:hypothetical protein